MISTTRDNRPALRLLRTTALVALVLALLGGGLLGARAHQQPMPGCNATTADGHRMQGLSRGHLLRHAYSIHTAIRPANRDRSSDTAVPPHTCDAATTQSYRGWALPPTDASSDNINATYTTRGATSVHAPTSAAPPTADAFEPAQPLLCPSRAAPAGADPEDTRREPHTDQLLAGFEGCPDVMPHLWHPALNTNEPPSQVNLTAPAAKLARHQPLAVPPSANHHHAGKDMCLTPWWWVPATPVAAATAIPRPSGALPAVTPAGTTKLWSSGTIIAASQPHNLAADAAGHTHALAGAAAPKAAVYKGAVWPATVMNLDCRHEPTAGLIHITCGTATAWCAMLMGARGAAMAVTAGSWGLRPAPASLLHAEAVAPLLLPLQPLSLGVCASECGDVRQSFGTVAMAEACCSSVAIAGGRQLLCGSNVRSSGLRLQPVHSEGDAASCACVASATVAPVGMGQQANLADRPAALGQPVVVGSGVESMHGVAAHGCGHSKQPEVWRLVCVGSGCRVDTAAASGRAAAHVLQQHSQSVFTSVLASCGVVLASKSSPAVRRCFSVIVGGVGGGLLTLLLVRAAACSMRQALASLAAARPLSAALVDAAVACAVPQPAHRMRLVGLRPSVLHGNSSIGSVVAARHCNWLPAGLDPPCCCCAARAGWLTCCRHLWSHPVNWQVR